MTPRKSSRRSSVKPPAVAREAVLSRPIGFAFGVTGPDGGAGKRLMRNLKTLPAHLARGETDVNPSEAA